MHDPGCAATILAGAAPPDPTTPPVAATLSDDLRHIVFRSAAPPVERTPRVPAAPSAPTSRDGARTRSLLEPPLAEFYEKVFGRHALQGSHYRESVLRRRAPASLRAVGAPDVVRASALLDRDPGAAARALHAVAIGVSSFFRDPAVFDGLREQLQRMASARPTGLRVLSIGCSDGRELYSVAMLLDEVGALHAASLAGIDCRASAIREAGAGVYPRKQVEAIPTSLRPSFFVPVRRGREEMVRVRSDLRARCRWTVADAFSFGAGEHWDVVLCRNLLIYLTPEAGAGLWRRLRDMLTPDGLLVAGKAERPPTTSGLRRVGHCLYRRLGAEA